jgi:hypothetical protein
MAADIVVTLVILTGGGTGDSTVVGFTVEGSTDDASTGITETGMTTIGIIEDFGITSGSKERPIPNSITI